MTASGTPRWSPWSVSVAECPSRYGVRAYRRVGHAGRGLTADLGSRLERESASRVDCADLHRRKALSRKGVRREVGTIARSAQSALCQRRHNAEYVRTSIAARKASHWRYVSAVSAARPGHRRAPANEPGRWSWWSSPAALAVNSGSLERLASLGDAQMREPRPDDRSGRLSFGLTLGRPPVTGSVAESRAAGQSGPHRRHHASAE